MIRIELFKFETEDFHLSLVTRRFQHTRELASFFSRHFAQKREVPIVAQKENKMNQKNL